MRCQASSTTFKFPKNITKESLTNLYWRKNLSSIEIAKLYGIAKSTILNYMRRYSIPRRSRSESSRLRVERDGIPWELKPNLEPSDDLAYVLGVCLGDGLVRQYGGTTGGRIILATVDKKFAEAFQRALGRIGLHPCSFTRKAKYRNQNMCRKQYVVKTNSKVFCEWYESFTLSDIRNLLIVNLKYIKEFLKGFYESEGNLKHPKKDYYYVRIFNTDKALIYLTKELLSYLNFLCSIRSSEYEPNKEIYTLWLLGGTSEALRFLSEINPCIKNIDYYEEGEKN